MLRWFFLILRVNLSIPVRELLPERVGQVAVLRGLMEGASLVFFEGVAEVLLMGAPI